MCWCSRIKPCLGVTGALCLVFLPPRSYRFTVGPSYDLLFLCIPWVGYITYFHWPALFFSCAHTHTCSALTYFFWIIQLEIREALGQTLPCLDCICGSFQRSGLHLFLLGVLHMQYQACKPLYVCLYFKACQFNALQCDEWTLENKDKGRCKKKNKQKKIESSIYDGSTLMGAVTFFGW